jgi:hypothetical protein
MAAPTADSSTSFTAFSGSLDITAPDPVDLGFVQVGVPAAVSFGNVQVIDGRSEAPGTGTWTASVSSTDFTNPSAGATLPASAITYVVPFCSVVGTVTCTPTAPVTLSGSAQPVINATTSSSGNTATWNPQFQFTVPAGSATGTYTGTVTHSVL